MLGTLLDGRYRVDTVIARGGMSTVYRGVDTRLDRPVAIKVMDPRFAGDQTFLDRFVREARSAARLRHPSVIGVYDQGLDHTPDGDHVFLVMELVDGGTLRDLLRQRHELSVALAVAVLEPVLSALAAAHRAGLVHRDIKPENVLIGHGGEIKVADFGLVRAVAEAGSTSDSMILGTVAYLSPEQVATGVADARSDVYSAAIVLFEMLTGSPPFTGDTALSVAYRHVNEDVPPPSSRRSGLPAALDQLVVRATRRNPAERPADAAAFLLALQRVRAQLDLPPVPVPAPLAPPGGSHEDCPTQPAGLTALGLDGPGPQGTRAFTRTPQLHTPPFPPAAGPPVDPYLRERTRDRRAFVIGLVVVLVLAGIVGFGAWHLAVGRWTEVPPLDNLDRGGIELALRTAGLDPDIVDDHHDVVPAGQVVSADPAAGSRVLRGRDVTVVLSQGRPRVPDIAAGTSADAAAQALTEADLTLRRDEGSDAYHDSVPANTVLGLAPPPGTELTVGAPVTVVLSKGPPPVAVPDVRGRTLDEAIAALRSAGLTSSAEPTRRFDRDVAGGKVIGTEPAAGQQTPKGSGVTLVVSTTLVVPDIVALPRPQALQKLREAGFDPVESCEDTCDDTARAYGTDPAAGTLVDPQHNRITVRISSQVPVPSVMGKSVGEARQLLEKLGLRVQVSQLLGGDSSAVISQNPGAGGRVPPGSVVQLTAFP